MKTSLFVKSIVAVATVSGFLSSMNPAFARGGSGVECSLTDVMFAGLSATSCYNGTGNDSGSTDITPLLSSNFGLRSDAWTLEGKSDGNEGRIDLSANGSTEGTWSFDTPFASSHLDGLSTFVLTLKASNKYSAYLFENIDFSNITDLTGTFNTENTSVNGRGNAQALSHASIFVANYTPYVASQPPVEQPPVEQPPATQPSSVPPSTTVVEPKPEQRKIPEPATTAALGFVAIGGLKLKRKALIPNQ